jgi:membrane protease YdiL (CAAX protease family)
MSMMTVHKLSAKWWLRILVFLAVTVGMFPLLMVLFQGQHYSLLNIFPSMLAESSIMCLIVLLISILIESSRKNGKWYSFGIMPGRWMLKEMGMGAGLNAGITFILLGFAVVFNIFRSEPSTYDMNYFWTISLLLFVEAAFEELVFRGIIFQAQLERFGIIVAIVLSSLIFALGHIVNPNVSVFAIINIILAGIMFSAMYIKTSSLWLPISFHFFWNWSQAMLGSDVSGINFNISVINIDWLSLPVWLFGGSFGLEGGVLATVFIIISTLMVLKYSNVSPYLASIIFNRKYAESMITSK